MITSYYTRVEFNCTAATHQNLPRPPSERRTSQPNGVHGIRTRVMSVRSYFRIKACGSLVAIESLRQCFSNFLVLRTGNLKEDAGPFAIKFPFKKIDVGGALIQCLNFRRILV